MSEIITNELIYRMIWNRNLSAYSENGEYENQEIKELLRKIDEKENELQELYAILKVIVEPKD